jgi:two-component system, LytTR family, sensor kinase
MSLFAFALCMPLGWVIRRTLNRPLARRLPAIGGACLPIAVVYGVVGHFVWMGLLEGSLPYSTAVSIAIQSQYNLLLFLLWSAFCAAILYAAQLQERERSLLEAQALAHEAELKMLRYQINPHFLFNTLNAVSALIVTGQTLAAEAMVAKLARFFRNALSRESTAKVTLEEDVRVQLEYLSIELTRFPDRLSWSIDIEAGLLHALVPHLILQPLFENAIKHGVARSAAPVQIRLAARRHAGQLIITVDNEARPGAEVDRRDGEGVGLTNVARRLASFYGAGARLSAERRDGRFIVELRLPVELTL